MQKILMIFLLVFACTATHAQSNLPDSHVNLGGGLGMSYGGIGVKTILGYRNSGLLIGLGHMPIGKVGYEIGAQVAIEFFYLNIGYGVSGTYRINDEPVQTIKCGNFMAGFMINLDKKKNVFLDLGIGTTINAPTIQFGPFEEKQGGVTFALGAGVRLAKKKKAEGN